MTDASTMVADLKQKWGAFAAQDFETQFMKWQFGARAQADFIQDVVKLLEDGVQIRAAMAFMADNTRAPKKLANESGRS
jgi:hypothetical protein